MLFEGEEINAPPASLAGHLFHKQSKKTPKSKYLFCAKMGLWNTNL